MQKMPVHIAGGVTTMHVEPATNFIGDTGTGGCSGLSSLRRYVERHALLLKTVQKELYSTVNSRGFLPV